MEWISVKDRLPDLRTSVWAYGPRLGQRESIFSLYPIGSIAHDAEPEKGVFWWEEPMHNWIQTWEVTHWMPLPDPPKES